MRFSYGISDHLKDNNIIIGAVAKGATWIEKHFKLTDNSSPDSKFSLNPKEYKKMVKSVNSFMLCLGNGNFKIEDNEIITRGIQRRSKADLKRPDSEYLKGLSG